MLQRYWDYKFLVCGNMTQFLYKAVNDYSQNLEVRVIFSSFHVTFEIDVIIMYLCDQHPLICDNKYF